MNVVTELKDAWAGVLAKWRRDRRAAEDARIEGGTALFAVSRDSPEGDIQAANQRAAWANQIKLLEQKEHRAYSDGLLLAQLRRNIRQVDEAEARHHPTPENMAGRRLADFGPVGGASGLLGAFSGVRLWMVLAGGWAVTGGLLGLWQVRVVRLHHDLTDAHHSLTAAVHNRDDWKGAYERQGELLAAARHQSDQTAQNLHHLEQQRAAAAAAERRRQHDIQNVASGIGEPPDFGLRDDPHAVPRTPATPTPTPSSAG